jgi:hypothetical protein
MGTAMTSITFSHTASETSKAAGIVTALVASFSEFCAGAREGQEIEARYRTYFRMSGPDLAARGLTRSDIYRAALVGRPV